MRAATRTRYGAALDVVEVVDRPLPELEPDRVLVRVAAGGLNSLDWRLTSAKPALIRLTEGMRAPRDPRLGEDVSGTVVAVGSAVTRFGVGETVFGQGLGSFSEFVAPREKHLAPAPTTVALGDAAALPVAGITALQAIRLGTIEPGSRVLVIGAAGGVGTYAVQLAVALGAEVTGVSRGHNVAHVLAQGASRVIDYTREELDGTYDLIIELAGATPIRRVAGMLATGGTLVLSSGDGATALGPLPRMSASVFVRGARVLASRTTTEDLLEVGRLAEAGSIRPVVTERYPLDRAAEAIAHLERGHTRGKVVLEP